MVGVVCLTLARWVQFRVCAAGRRDAFWDVRDDCGQLQWFCGMGKHECWIWLLFAHGAVFYIVTSTNQSLFLEVKR